MTSSSQRDAVTKSNRTLYHVVLAHQELNGGGGGCGTDNRTEVAASSGEKSEAWKGKLAGLHITGGEPTPFNLPVHCFSNSTRPAESSDELTKHP